MSFPKFRGKFSKYSRISPINAHNNTSQIKVEIKKNYDKNSTTFDEDLKPDTDDTWQIIDGLLDNDAELNGGIFRPNDANDDADSFNSTAISQIMNSNKTGCNSNTKQYSKQLVNDPGFHVVKGSSNEMLDFQQQVFCNTESRSSNNDLKLSVANDGCLIVKDGFVVEENNKAPKSNMTRSQKEDCAILAGNKNTVNNTKCAFSKENTLGNNILERNKKALMDCVSSVGKISAQSTQNVVRNGEGKDESYLDISLQSEGVCCENEHYSWIVKVCPVNKADVVNNDFLAILTMADASSVAWSTHSSFDSLADFFLRDRSSIQKFTRKLLWHPFSAEEIKVTIEEGEEGMPTTTETSFSHDGNLFGTVKNKVVMMFNNTKARKWINTYYPSAKGDHTQRSLYIENTDSRLTSDLLKAIFPCALKICDSESGNDRFWQVETESPEAVANYLSVYTMISLNGVDIKLLTADIINTDQVTGAVVPTSSGTAIVSGKPIMTEIIGKDAIDLRVSGTKIAAKNAESLVKIPFGKRHTTRKVFAGKGVIAGVGCNKVAGTKRPAAAQLAVCYDWDKVATGSGQNKWGTPVVKKLLSSGIMAKVKSQSGVMAKVKGQSGVMAKIKGQSHVMAKVRGQSGVGTSTRPGGRESQQPRPSSFNRFPMRNPASGGQRMARKVNTASQRGLPPLHTPTMSPPSLLHLPLKQPSLLCERMMSDVDPRTSELRKIHDNVQNEIRGAMIGLPSEACQPGDFFSTPGRPLQRPDGFVTGNPNKMPPEGFESYRHIPVNTSQLTNSFTGIDDFNLQQQHNPFSDERLQHRDCPLGVTSPQDGVWKSLIQENAYLSDNHGYALKGKKPNLGQVQQKAFDGSLMQSLGVGEGFMKSPHFGDGLMGPAARQENMQHGQGDMCPRGGQYEPGFPGGCVPGYHGANIHDGNMDIQTDNFLPRNQLLFSGENPRFARPNFGPGLQGECPPIFSMVSRPARFQTSPAQQRVNLDFQQQERAKMMPPVQQRGQHNPGFRGAAVGARFTASKQFR